MFYRKIIKELEKWKQSTIRKPLVIRGARQVGKTTVVNEFAKQFDQYIYINLENDEDRIFFEETTNVHKLAQKIFFYRGLEYAKISSTLLFIDEIQELPSAVNMLRYFKEELSELAVIAAGSMLETMLGKNVTFPVGRVEFKVLRPVSFEEFLGALGEKRALEELQNVPLNEYAHSKLLELFHIYAFLGGMPEIINKYVQTRDITSLESIYQSLINSYLDDAEKYCKSDTDLQLIRFCINQVMFQAGKRITFQGFGNSNYKSREISETLRTLAKTHLLHLIYPVTGYDIPLQEDYKKAPRLQFLDSGLINHFVGIQKFIIGTKDLNSVYQGRLIEHLVGQELLSVQHEPLKKLHFWVREKNSSQAELDYLLPFEGEIVPIEVKSGLAGTIKSLQLYLDESSINFAIRFYAGELSIEKRRTYAGKVFYLLNLPYYLATQTEKYIRWFKSEISEQKDVYVFEEPEVLYKKVKQKKKVTYTKDDLNDKHLSVLSYCKTQARKGKEIIEDLLGLTYQTKNKQIYINSLFDLGFLEWTIKEFPKSKQQAYRITKAGDDFLNTNKKGD